MYRIYMYRIYMYIGCIYIYIFKLQDNAGKWPSAFDGTFYMLQETRTDDFYTVSLEIDEIQKGEYLEELSNNTKNFEHVLVYDNGGIKHAVHVDKLSKSNKVVCENSFGPKDADVRIALDDVLNLYRVYCSAEKVLLPQRGPTAVKAATATTTPTTKVYDELMISSSGQIPGMF